MRSLLLMILMTGCATYFGGDDGGDSRIPPDGAVPDSGAVCPQQKPTDGSQCSFHQSGLSCWYDFECYCGEVGPNEYAWNCNVLYDGGV